MTEDRVLTFSTPQHLGVGYTLHFHDPTDDKPQPISEEDALRIIGNYYVGEAIREKRWEELQRGEVVHVRTGRLVRATD